MTKYIRDITSEELKLFGKIAARLERTGPGEDGRLLPSRRETFHAKVVLADASSFYVGSSNFMGSALDRSFECGVIVHGETARQLRYVLAALQSVAKSIPNY